MNTASPPSPYAPRYDRGNCGIGFVADRHGRRSHALLRMGLEALGNLQHRGALDADARTGDGAGLLTPLPHALFAREAERLTGQRVAPEQLGVGVFFLQPGTEEQAMRLAEAAFAWQQIDVLAWRAVPTQLDVLGKQARATLPALWHALVCPQPQQTGAGQFEQRLFMARKRFERQARPLGAYVPSCSSRTIVYKGLLLAPQVPAFYTDLQDPDFTVPLVVFHQRYSTNTAPTWQRAQPFRMLCHNGEINTLQGNLAWMQAREPLLAADFCADAADLRPVADTDGSDSAMLDNVAELLVHGGRDVRHALTMLVPPAWERVPDLPESVRDFLAFHAGLTEPWDGPAALVFTDGRLVGATLDRNGLRPCRYLVTEDGLVAAASEAGAVPVPPESIQLHGKLGPGQMLSVDTTTGELMDDAGIKQALAARRPYGAWMRGARENRRQTADDRRQTVSNGGTSQEQQIDSSQGVRGAHRTQAELVVEQSAFGYTSEELVMVLRPMVENKAEAIGSMGDDTPLAVLSDKPRSLFSYFRQRFAEVTNPPIDPLREELVMSLRVRLGARANFLSETPAQASLLVLDSPCLSEAGLAALRDDPALHSVTLSTLFQANDGPAGLAAALARLQQAAGEAVAAGAEALILSDRGVNAEHTFIPALLALAAVHHYLLREDLRTRVDLVVETGEAREVHHFAALIGYGAAAVNPYLALETVSQLVRGETTPAEAEANFLHAIEHGLLKIMSKMGISTADAYCGAQIFETLGIAAAVVEEFFVGTTHHLGGLSLEGIAGIVLRWHQTAFGGTTQPALPSPGFYKFKRTGELHAYSPAIVHALHAAVKSPGALEGNWKAGYAAYQKYSQLQHATQAVDIHDLLGLRLAAEPLPLAQVESSHAILWRFSTAAMSHGALSAEAHATMAIAMNRLDALSNSGEGGEDPARYDAESNDRIKQVASARFGVTAAYLVAADELQIKMAQGSKPGEGGQLPGHKVTAEIAAIRHATPGVTLISPPPHHDIYSIEDLAQLIYDLRQINPHADISVKLVAQSGVGTIAAGVAKAGADVIHIGGNSGGTGASPLSSIKYAGIPWELGLAEAQYVLSESGLRGRVRLRVDGGLRTGRDVVVAALLGADEFSFGTAAVVAEGCVMARACHLNTCPAGIATQRPELRAKFDATPEHVMAFMLYVAQEVRETLAALGLSGLDAAVGRVDLLESLASEESALDLSKLLLAAPGRARRYLGEPNRVNRAAELNDRLLAEAGFLEGGSFAGGANRGQSPLLQGEGTARGHSPHLQGGGTGFQQLAYTIGNRDRTFGARLAGEIARRHGDAGLPEGSIEVALTGHAGQSFGAFGVPGLNLTLHGQANDYVGKGLTGGRLVVAPVADASDPAEAPVMAGNTVLYGATGGVVFIGGRAGERFAVRNSGAVAVVEGVGDHGCEYMTGGLVICLGPIGYNFAAGMSGGLAFVMDDRLETRLNRQMVRAEALTPEDLAYLRVWVTQHAVLTGSPRAAALLDEWAEAGGRFTKIVPHDQPTPVLPIPVELPAVEGRVMVRAR